MAESPHPPGRSLAVLLHAHLPDCRTPDQPASLEETWFFEALAECYLPLVRMLDRLDADGVPVRLTLSLSPTLIGMLKDPALGDRFRRRIVATEQLAWEDARTNVGRHREVSAWHARFFGRTRRLFDERCGGDVLRAWRGQAERGLLELATTAATHAFLPGFQAHDVVVRSQVAAGLDTFQDAFGFRPSFFWLPECGYFPGVEDVLGEFGVRAFALETHGITGARPPPSDLRAPVRCPNGVLAVGRDAELSRVVWSAAQGYPGDPNYREFHRDRVHELSDEAVANWLGGSTARLPSGLKYHRVTGRDDEKGWYDPAVARDRAREHARDFVTRLTAAKAGAGLRFAPFDAELFGHWWFEGPYWLEHVYRQLADTTVVATSATPALTRHPHPHDARPAASSWGHDGDYSFWVNPDNAWIYPQLAQALTRLQALLPRLAPADPVSIVGRALRQAARTLLLAQASDWAFLLRADTAAAAAREHLGGLLARFATLCDGLENQTIDETTLRDCERKDAAFPRLDLKWFGSSQEAQLRT